MGFTEGTDSARGSEAQVCVRFPPLTAAQRTSLLLPHLRAAETRLERQSLGLCHDQRDLDNTAGRTVENKRGTHLGMDGKQQRMPWLSSTHPQEMEQIRQRSTTLQTKTHLQKISVYFPHGIWRRTRTTIDFCLPMRVLQFNAVLLFARSFLGVEVSFNKYCKTAEDSVSDTPTLLGI